MYALDLLGKLGVLLVKRVFCSGLIMPRYIVKYYIGMYVVERGALTVRVQSEVNVW